jgi:hypothetical protein
MITVLPRTSPLTVTPRVDRVAVTPRIGTVGLVVHTDHAVFHTAFVVVGDAPPGALPGDGLDAENGDNLMTEAGERMTTE